MTTLRELVVDLPCMQNEKAHAFRVRTADGIKGISRREFRDDVYRLGGWILTNCPGGCVCILGSDGYEWAVAHVSLTCGAGIAVGLDKELSAQELASQIKQCDAMSLLYTRQYKGTAEQVRESAGTWLRIYCIDDLLEVIRLDPKDYCSSYAQRLVAFDDVVAIFFTSGTTGTTKGIQLTHRNMVASIIGIDGWSGYDEKDILLQVLPMHHCYACICGIYLILMTGTVICICDSPRHILECIRLFKPNTLHAVPAIYEMLLKAFKASGMELDQFFGTHFKWFVSGGAALSKETAAAYMEYGLDIYNGYGTTECASAIIIEDKKHSRPGSIGKPLTSCEVQIIDNEICVRGDVVFKGYLHDEAATKSVLYDGWFHTGDLGLMDEEGFVTITGRKKNLIILENGKNVSPEELERDLISAIPQIREVQVYAIDGLIVAEIYPGSENKTDQTQKVFDQAIIAFNRSQPLYRQVRRVIIRDQPFPKTSTQKMIRTHNEK